MKIIFRFNVESVTVYTSCEYMQQHINDLLKVPSVVYCMAFFYKNQRVQDYMITTFESQNSRLLRAFLAY